jgi:hypothetical protein
VVNYIRKGVKPLDPLYGDLYTVDVTNVAQYQRKQRETGGRF